MKILCPICELWLVSPEYLGRGEITLYCLRCESEENRHPFGEAQPKFLDAPEFF